MTRIYGALIAFLLAIPLVTSAAAKEKSLYERLGGYDAIAAVTDDFITSLATDKDFSRFFVGFSTDSKMRIRQNIVDLFCRRRAAPATMRAAA